MSYQEQQSRDIKSGDEATRLTPPSPTELRWDIDGATRVLRAEQEPLHHSQLGSGTRLFLLEGGGSTMPRLDLFPERLLARYRSSLLRIDLSTVASITAYDDHVRLESADDAATVSGLVYPDGAFTLALLGKGTIEGPSESPHVPPPQIESVATAASPADPEAQADRVVFTGRIGRDPQIRTTANGRTIARLPLAVHYGEQTVWKTILFFDEAAETAAQSLGKGQLVTIVGYQHIRQVPQKGGGTKDVEEIYAASVQGTK